MSTVVLAVKPFLYCSTVAAQSFRRLYLTLAFHWHDLQGRLTLLLGPPGAGKTTLLKALSGKLRRDKSLKVQIFLPCIVDHSGAGIAWKFLKGKSKAFSLHDFT